MTKRRFLTAAACIAALLALRAQCQTTFVGDTFTVGVNTMLEAHTPDTGGAWTRRLGTNGITINAAADNARNVSAGDWNVYTNAAVPSSAEYVVGVTVTFSNANANNWVDLFGRASVTLQDAYHARLQANGTVTLFDYIGGTPTTLGTGTATVPLNTAIPVLLVLKNASKEVWVNGTRIISSANNAITVAGIAGLGMDSNTVPQAVADDFFASTFSPTAAKWFQGRAIRDGPRARVSWSTSEEVSTLGFRVHQGSRVSDLIAGSAFLTGGSKLPAGNAYAWLDQSPGREPYWIEEVEVDGKRAWHGPYVATRGKVDPRAAASRTFSAISRQVAPATRATHTSAAIFADAAPASRHRSVDPHALLTSTQFRLAASPDALKISVTQDGWIRIPQPQLIAAGLDANVDPRRLHLYAGGQEIPITIEGESDGHFDAADALRFYGTALDTPSTDAHVYWLTAEANNGARIAPVASASDAVGDAQNFLATAERRDKTIYFAALRDPDGDSFVGPEISSDAGNPTIQSLHVEHIDRTATQTPRLTVAVQGAGDVGAPHRVTVSLNGKALGELDFNATDKGTETFDVPPDAQVEGDNAIALSASDDSTAVVSVAVTYAHTYAASDDQLLASVDAEQRVRITGFTSDDVHVLDITNPNAPVEIEPRSASGGTVDFTIAGSGAHNVLAITGSRFAAPASVVRNVASDLHDAEGADLVIVAHPSLVPALDPLVQLRQSQGLRVIVAAIDDVYDEFSFGAKDPAAIRLFLETARRWKAAPRWVLLAGDASIDPRNYLGFGAFDLVPTKYVISDLLTTASDAWFTDFDNDGASDVAIGRLPVRTIEDARIEVGKIVAYDTVPAASWMQKVIFVSDDDPQIAFGPDSRSAAANVPPALSVTRIDLAQSGVASGRQQLLTAVNDGALLLDYVGHGSVEVWTGDGLFSDDDALALTNGSRLPVVIAMTCLNGLFQDVYTESLGETLLRAPNGGAVAVWASTTLTSADAEAPAHDALMKTLFSDGATLGDATLAAEAASVIPDVRRCFVLFGDPSMRLRR